MFLAQPPPVWLTEYACTPWPAATVIGQKRTEGQRRSCTWCLVAGEAGGSRDSWDSGADPQARGYVTVDLL